MVSSKTNNDSNIEVHHTNTNVVKEKEYTCPECDDTFKTETDRQGHVKNEHSKHILYVCPECDNVFQIKTDLEKHNKLKHVIFF